MRGERAPWLVRPLVLVACAALAAGCNAILGPTDVDENWSVHDSPHFSLHARPGSFAEQQSVPLAAALEEQYAVTIASLGVTYEGRISAFLYNSAADAGLMSDHSGVAYPTTEAIRAVCVPPLDGNLVGLLGHEANHVILENTLGRAGTHFLSEGMASAVLSERIAGRGPAALHAWCASRLSQIPPMAELADDDRWNRFDQQMAYTASASFLAYLRETGGATRIRQLFQVSSQELAGRIQELYGKPLDEVERDWRAFVQRPR